MGKHFKVGDHVSWNSEAGRVSGRIIAHAPRLFAERYRPHPNLTLLHGDAHVWNALYPRDPASDDVGLIDWDGWRIDVATDDLAYMIAVHWSPARRRRVERECLRRYHAALSAAGVKDYDFEALWQDYRLSVLSQIATPVWQAAHGIGPWIWWYNYERIMAAVDDLDCLEFLGWRERSGVEDLVIRRGRASLLTLCRTNAKGQMLHFKT